MDTKNFKFWFNNHNSENLYYKCSKNTHNQRQTLLTYENGDLYSGKLLQGRMEGKGVYYDATNKRSIESEFSAGKKNGKTVIKSSNSDFFFDGIYFNDQR